MNDDDHEDVARIAEQIYQAIVQEHLTVLGLASRLEGTHVAGEEWLRLLKLSYPVIECISHVPPDALGGSVCIDSMPGVLDASGRMTLATTVGRVYWIPRADLPKLQKLEAVLDGMRPCRLH